MLSILNKFTLQKELQTFVTKMCCWTKNKNTTTTKQKLKHKNPCRIRGLNPGPLAPKVDALPLHHHIQYVFLLFVKNTLFVTECCNSFGDVIYLVYLTYCKIYDRL